MMLYAKSGKADWFIINMIYRHAVNEETRNHWQPEKDEERMRRIYWQILWSCDAADPTIRPELMANILAFDEHLFPPLSGPGESKEWREKIVQQCIPQVRDGKVEYLNLAGNVDCFELLDGSENTTGPRSSTQMKR